METTNVRRELNYEGFNHQRWLMSIHFDNNIVVTCNGETRTYTIPEKITAIIKKDEYVFIYVDDAKIKFYQFKFEVDNFLVADIFDEEHDFIDSFASYVFGEE